MGTDRGGDPHCRGTVPCIIFGEFVMHWELLNRPARIRVCFGAIAAIVGLLLGVLGVGLRPQTASATMSSVMSRGLAGVTADPLPTVQINGIVWTQVIVGNTVYAGGKFSSARPAGAAPGKSTVARSNLLAFDIRTGALINGFAPRVNGTVRSLAVSPDKKTLYVGGAFTAVDGKRRLRFAAVAAATGTLKALAPAFNGEVRAILPTSRTAYVGGQFTKVGTKARSRLAAVKVSNGKLLSWKPAANGYVYAMTWTPDRKALVAGGNFSKVGKAAACGMSRLSTRGKVLTWSINKVVKDCGKGTAIMSLITDGGRVYGSGYSYGGGNYEGVFAATNVGNLVWLQDCRGDTYDVAVAHGRVYSVGHPHNCGNIGGFPDTKPRTYYPALAVTMNATGTVGSSPGGYKAFKSKPSPSLIHWFPSMTPGNVSGMQQAAWSIVASGPYLVFGGEFTAVNGKPQQGLVRMGTTAVAPRLEGPYGVSVGSKPAVAANRDGSATVTWQTAWDRDDQQLTYTLTRDGSPVDRRKVASNLWQRATQTFVDTTVTPGKHTWRIEVADPDGNTVVSQDTVAEQPTL